MLDYAYTDLCAENAPETVALSKSIASAAERFPVITGYAYKRGSELRAIGQLSESDKMSTNEVIVEQSNLDAKAQSALHFGLVTLNCDVRKIPLSWAAYGGIEGLKQHDRRELDDLAVDAAGRSISFSMPTSLRMKVSVGHA